MASVPRGTHEPQVHLRHRGRALRQLHSEASWRRSRFEPTALSTAGLRVVVVVDSKSRFQSLWLCTLESGILCRGSSGDPSRDMLRIP